MSFSRKAPIFVTWQLIFIIEFKHAPISVPEIVRCNAFQRMAIPHPGGFVQTSVFLAQ